MVVLRHLEYVYVCVCWGGGVLEMEVHTIFTGKHELFLGHNNTSTMYKNISPSRWRRETVGMAVYWLHRSSSL